MKRTVQQGFTLIELMIVVLIIGILVSLLFPTLNMVRYAAGQAVCASNMRQIGLAITEYQNDNNDRMPPVTCKPWDYIFGGQYADWPYGSWDRFLVQYLGTGAAAQKYDPWTTTATPANVRVPVYRCKLDRQPDNDGVQRRSYAFNGGARFNIRDSWIPFRLSSVIPVSPTYVPSSTTLSEIAMLFDDFRPFPTGDNSLGFPGGSYQQAWGDFYPTTCHARGDTNILYMDIHVKRFRDWANKDKTFYYVVRSDPP